MKLVTEPRSEPDDARQLSACNSKTRELLISRFGRSARSVALSNLLDPNDNGIDVGGFDSGRPLVNCCWQKALATGNGEARAIRHIPRGRNRAGLGGAPPASEGRLW